MTVLIAKDAVREPLYVVVPLQNPWRFKSRYKHTERVIKHLMDVGAVVVLVEVAFNRRDFVFADSGLDGTPANCGVLGSDHRFRHRYVPLRSRSELWLKENQIAIGVSHALPYDWEQVAWVDGDVHFVRPNVIGECIHRLQHFDFLQMFSHARDIDPEYEVLPEDYPHAEGMGFVSAFNRGLLQKPAPGADPTTYYPPRVFPGLAWACTRRAWDVMGGLIDFAVWGGGDYHLAHCLVGKAEGMMRNDLHPNYQMLITEYFDRCQQYIRRNVGMMTGSIFHYWHGRKAERGYNVKHALLAQAGFDPLRHLKRDYQGLWQLHDDGSESFIMLRDTMREIARLRNEDSNDTRLPPWGQGH